jgi:hypothetical protein
MTNISAQPDLENRLNIITDHFKDIVKNYPPVPEKIPRSLNEDGSIRLIKSEDWTSGFYPGTLWLIYKYSRNKDIGNAAAEWTEFIKKEQFNANDHDIGFKIMCSVGQAYSIEKTEVQKEIIIQSAETLISRFDEKIGAIKSWNSWNGQWNYPVIIDNMMNLELLFKASELTDNPVYYDIAVIHANTTLKNHYRDDYSCYHVVDYDSASGRIIRKVTHQGYDDESSWARGQSWGLYGFVMAYRFTKDPVYLNTAKNIAEYLLDHPNMPDDLVPYWDYNAPDIPNAQKDVSAAAIMASALYELWDYSNRESKYLNSADKIIASINEKYLLDKKGLPFITASSVGHFSANSEINVPINYADYYYLEALLRRVEISGK